ncbi:MAG: hypothetical protein CTY31_14135 [Hyphomicrobium sp.]|nr:MAG: hypothetical protein CTY31_14135 [Hyphomicrobium sp.]
MTSDMNQRRAACADKAGGVFSEIVNADNRRQAIQDLVCDIGHLCDREDLDFQKIVVIAVGWWHAERIDPGGIHAEPYVTLSIDGVEVVS